MARLLEGRRALVCGSSQGIGRRLPSISRIKALKSFSSPGTKRSCNACVASSAPTAGKDTPIWPPISLIPTA